MTDAKENTKNYINIVGSIVDRKVYIDGKELLPNASLKLRNHSPDGFNWGYGGSGPAQLALAVLLEITDTKTALRLYQTFKASFIAKLKQGEDFKFVLHMSTPTGGTITGKGGDVIFLDDPISPLESTSEVERKKKELLKFAEHEKLVYAQGYLRMYIGYKTDIIGVEF